MRLSCHRRRDFAIITSAVVLASAASLAAPPTVIYSKIAGHPTAAIPGVRDLTGTLTVSDFRALEDLMFAPDGYHWVIKGRNQLGTDLETQLLMGAGTSGTTFAQEGQPIPTGAAGELFDFFGSSQGSGRFNRLNQFAYSARARGGVASVFHKVIFWNGATSSIVFAMGSPISGLVDTGTSGDETFGNSVGSIHLLDNGTIGSQDSTIGNIATSRRPAIMYNQAAFHQTNVTTVTGFGGVGTQTWTTIDANSFYTTPDGLHWIATGDIFTLPANLNILVVDGAIALQQGQLVGASPLLMGDVFQSGIVSNGDWFARGRDNSGTTTAAPDWAVRNGTVLARTGDPIVTGSAETWGDTFSAVAINRAGDWVLVGNTAGGTGGAASDNVLVFNGQNVVCREGDMVDLNNDGNANDDAFIGRGTNTLAAFEPNDLFISDSRMIYAFATLRNGAGADLNSTPAFGTPQVFLRMEVPCRVDWDRNNQVNPADVAGFINSWFSSLSATDLNSGDFDDNGAVNPADVAAYVNRWFDAVQNGC